MFFVFSPAKKLNVDFDCDQSEYELPVFQNQAKVLGKVLKEKSVNDLKKLMKLSDKLAELNVDRNQVFGKKNNIKQPAIYTFKGDTYLGFDADNLAKKNVKAVNDKLIILSGLYGMLRPLDIIEPYRLEMGTSLKFADYNNLYDFWKPVLTKKLNERILKTKDDVLINLSSNEYFSALDEKTLKAKIYTPNFKVNKDGQLKSIGMMSKKARGMMGRFITENGLYKKGSDPKRLQEFNLDGYKFSKSHSDEFNFTFIKEA